VKKYIVISTQKKKSQQITSMTDIIYKRVAYIEIAIYIIIAIYFIQKFLLKYYIEDIKQNNLEYSKGVGSIFTSSIAGMSPLQAFNNLIIERFKSLFSLISGMFNNIFGSVGNIAGDQIKALDGIRNIMKPIRNFITDATMFFYRMLEKFTRSITYTFHRLRQLIRRSLSSFNLIFHALENMRNLMVSVVNSPVTSFLFDSADTINWVSGKLNRLCFDSHTPVLLKDNTTKYIKDLQCGDELADGNIITSTIEFLNKEPMYSIYSNTLNSDIYVTGSHIVYDNKNNLWKTVAEYNLAQKTDYIPTKLYCISTSTHKIQIGDILFSDYEEISDNDSLTHMINRYILCGLNHYLSAIENDYLCQPTKHMDSGLYKGTLIHMKDNTWKKIEDISIGDTLYDNVNVIGKVKILGNSHKWYKLDDIILTDSTKIYNHYYKLWQCIGNYEGSIEYINIDNEIGYQLIVSSNQTNVIDEYIEILGNNKIYKIADFIQIHDKKIQNKIEEIGMMYMNKK
jgi:hypothetical protein